MGGKQLTAEQIVAVVNRGTGNAARRVRVLYQDQDFVLVRHPGHLTGLTVNGSARFSPWVARYPTDVVRKALEASTALNSNIWAVFINETGTGRISPKTVEHLIAEGREMAKAGKLYPEIACDYSI